jgi:hypothetical protein
MVDVEIIDAKNDNQSIFVSAGQEACVCAKVRDWGAFEQACLLSLSRFLQCACVPQAADLHKQRICGFCCCSSAPRCASGCL